jgi:pyruvate kinase
MQLKTSNSNTKTESNQPFGTLLNLSSPQNLLSTLQELRQTVESEGQATFNQWRSHIQRTEFLSSALNLAEYLALRRHDLRSLQAALMPWGLSSLGRIEARVMPNLDAVIATLEVICGSESAQHLKRPPIEFFFEGDRLLQQHTEELFGQSPSQRRVRIMVKDGTPSRGEMTDAAMAERAECVMLNKGPFIAEAIAILDDVLTRMEAHQLKKTPQLRALHSW